MSQLVPDAANVTPPGSGGTITVPSGASTAGLTGQDLSAYAGRWLWVKADVKTHVRFGTTPTAASAATTNDMYLTADVDYMWRIPKDGSRSGIRVYGTGAGKLYYRVTSGPQ